MDDRNAQPDWMPRASAIGLPDGHQRHGSTGQLWEVRNGQWVRIDRSSPDDLAEARRLAADLLGQDAAHAVERLARALLGAEKGKPADPVPSAEAVRLGMIDRM